MVRLPFAWPEERSAACTVVDARRVKRRVARSMEVLRSKDPWRVIPPRVGPELFGGIVRPKWRRELKGECRTGHDAEGDVSPQRHRGHREHTEISLCPLCLCGETS